MKRIISVLLISLLFSLVCLNAVGAADGSVVYNGRKIVVNGEENYGNLLPGETIAVEFEIRNEANKKTNWYIANDVISSFESAGAAKDGAYTYSLAYNGNELYSSDKVGGSGLEGLKQINDETNGAFFYLDSLEPNGSGKISFKIGLDGESQANDYMEAIARLQLRFAVEEENRTEKTVTKVRYYIPTTGVNGVDRSDSYSMYYALMAISSLIMTASAAYLFYSGRRAG